jgi:hypothetical protein
MYARFITDPDVEELSFEDQRHYVFLLCMKCDGLLDKDFDDPEKRDRAIARRLGLQGEAYTFAKDRLIGSRLVDENLQPRSWNSLQFKSDHSAAERQRKSRSNRRVTTMSRDSHALEQNRTDTEQKQNRVTTAASRPAEGPEFAQLKQIFPKRNGNQPWQRAKKAINARLAEGSTWYEILEGARRYAAWCSATGKLNTESVMQAATFCGPEKPFTQPWTPPATKADNRLAQNLSAAQQFLERTNAAE